MSWLRRNRRERTWSFAPGIPSARKTLFNAFTSMTVEYNGQREDTEVLLDKKQKQMY